MRILESFTSTLTFWVIFTALAGGWFYYSVYVARELPPFVSLPIIIIMFVIAVLCGVLSFQAILRDES